jgi:hypothetical protein
MKSLCLPAARCFALLPVHWTGNPYNPIGRIYRSRWNDSHGVVVARGNGTRTLVPVAGARRMGVRCFYGLHGPGNPGAGPGPVVERTP